MYFRKYVALAIASLFALCVALLIFRIIAKPEKKSAAAKGVCPSCGQKLRWEGASCSYCQYLERTKGPGSPGGPGIQSELTPVGKLAIASVVLGLMTLGVYWSDVRRLLRQWFTTPEETLVTRCQKCKRKLRYPVSSIGKTGLCPGCGVKFDFPNAVGKVPIPAAATE
jgi:hypothetical protein